MRRGSKYGELRAYIFTQPLAELGICDRPTLLHVSELSIEASKALHFDESPPHQDERQIGLDTDRSFVLYPVGGKLSVLFVFCQLKMLLFRT